MSLPDFLPYSAARVIAEGLQKDMDDHAVVLRRLGTTEPSLTIGVYADNLTLVSTSQELGSNEPTLSRYGIKIQNLVKGTDREATVNYSAINSKIVRVLLYRSSTIQLGLSELVETNSGSIERFQQLFVMGQKFLDGQVGKSFMFLTTTDVIVETETVNL